MLEWAVSFGFNQSMNSIAEILRDSLQAALTVRNGERSTAWLADLRRLYRTYER